MGRYPHCSGSSEGHVLNNVPTPETRETEHLLGTPPALAQGPELGTARSSLAELGMPEAEPVRKAAACGARQARRQRCSLAVLQH